MSEPSTSAQWRTLSEFMSRPRAIHPRTATHMTGCILRWGALLATLLVIVSCDTPLPEGHYGCRLASDCPSDWVCRNDGYCWSTPPGSTSEDAGSMTDDAGSMTDDAGNTMDAGPTECVSPLTDCGGTCVDTARSTTHCGACNNRCSFLNASAICSAGRCSMGGCNAGYYDCNGSSADGCESNRVCERVTELALGEDHSCALLSTGEVKCWGDNSDGQLGDGTSGYDVDRSTPVTVIDITNATAIAAGSEHTCALLRSGRIQCWGENWRGQLGDGSNTDRSTPVDVNGIETGMAITAGANHTCAVLMDGDVFCWGANTYGQLGIYSTDHENTPQDTWIDSVTAIGAGGEHTCAVDSLGHLYCWGKNNQSQLGTSTSLVDMCGDTRCEQRPRRNTNLDGLEAVTGSLEYTCALGSFGTVYCWGRLNYLLDVTTSASGTNRPYPIDGVSAAAVVASTSSPYSLSAHTCILRTSGGVICGGSCNSGQCGHGSTDSDTRFETVLGITNATAIGVGGSHTCAALSTGIVRCWGENSYGQLGDGSTLDRNRPVDVMGIP